MKTKIIFLLFIALVFVQWFVPAQMIYHQEDILKTGKIYKFRVAPIDPYDAFRGKFIYLNFTDNQVDNNSNMNYEFNDVAFVTIKDSNGYAILNSIYKEKPTDVNCLKVGVNTIFDSKINKKVTVNFPFDRYYMNEFKAQKAEDVYTNAIRDLKQNIYALVAVKDGDAVVKDVIIDNISIAKYIQK